jgi:opacity protein-like surface antigen
MKTLALVLAVIIACSASDVIAQYEEENPTDDLNERLGIRAGYGWTPNDVSESFGGGLNLTLHFIHRFKKPLAVNVELGAIYLGSTDSHITQDFFGAGVDFDKLSMRILTFTASPMLEFSVSERTDFFFSAGGGLYAVTLLIDEGLFEFDATDNHLGVTVAAGLIRRLSTNWFFDASIHAHKFWTADELNIGNPDWIFVYSEGDSDPLLWTANVGVALRMF